MKAAVALLSLLLLVDSTSAAEESCVGLCGSFDPGRKCQCDSMCVYYTSCCGDFSTVCAKKVTRGDTFDNVEENSTTNATPTVSTAAPTLPPTTTFGPTTHTDLDAAPCSGRPFDAFLQLKNGSIYAFRGEYFFELDDSSILPGYPKLIQDTWGISGPISAAFTRINCQGKSYIFKGSRYWRFSGDVLDEGFPRDISEGFDGIPNDVDAAFTLPAPNHRGKEKAYFFKGDKYYKYEFKHQPSHEECVQMTRASPSVLFTQYTDLFCDHSGGDFFASLFGSTFDTDPRFISRDWHGIQSPVDAAMVGRVHLSVKPTSPPRRWSNRRRGSSRRRGPHRRRQSHRWMADLWLDDDFDLSMEESDFTDQSTTPNNRHIPVQNVYFFKKDKYYRVGLRTKHVDVAIPPYPRSIAKYWLGCKEEERPDNSKAEKK